jgi:hypothetical protein
METPSKQKKAYYRKLYLAWLIDNGRHDLLSLERDTGMPRRTLQDCIKAMADIGIVCEFIQDGPKHRHGYYQVLEWGDHRREWLASRRAEIEAMLEIG